MRTDGFRKVVRSYNVKKKVDSTEKKNSHSNIHTSNGFRRVSKEYNIGVRNGGESRVDCSKSLETVKSRKIMTAEKYQPKKTMPRKDGEKNEEKAVILKKYEK
jgi:hypothetical protein